MVGRGERVVASLRQWHSGRRRGGVGRQRLRQEKTDGSTTFFPADPTS